MKKFFTLAIAACFGLAASAQDTSGWNKGDDITTLINWKAYDAKDEDPAAPVWQGFEYGKSGEWEFRPAGTPQIENLQTDDANDNKLFMCWGVYNLPPLDVYQEFEMPAGVYVLSVAGCYRHGQDDATLKLYAAEDQTKNCFVYVQVGDDVYETAMQYKFDASITEPLGATFSNNNWGNEKGYGYNGTTIYSPQSHCAADWYLENGKFTGNDVLFAVPENGTKVRVGIKKPVAIAQDQVWWNHWTMTYDGEFNEEAKAMIACKTFEKEQAKASTQAQQVGEKYPTLGALMSDEIDFIEIEDRTSLESVNKAIEEVRTAIDYQAFVFAKTQAMEKALDICQGILTLTEYAGKATFQAAVQTATDLLNLEDLPDGTTLDTFVKAADDLGKSRIEYLLTQEKGADGSYDFTHALAYPWWVNQEFTGVHDADGYHYPENVVEALNGTDDGVDSNLETGICSKGEIEPVSSKAGWSNKADAENTWIYVDNWNGWHGGMKACIQKLKGAAGINSDWSTGVGQGDGGMEVYQNLSNLPDGFYTLEGLVWHNSNEENSPNWRGDINYLFFEDGEGNVLAKEYQVVESPGYWNGWSIDQYTVLKTDFVELKGGKARVGYFNKCWFLNSIMELKYYGTQIDYTGIVQQKVKDAEPAEGELWPGDLKAYNDMIKKIVYPIAGADDYTAAIAIINEATAFKQKAAGVTGKFDAPQKYLDIQNKYDDGDQYNIIQVAWKAVMDLGDGDNDSYTDAETATEICSKYALYMDAYDEAITDYFTDAMKEVINTQTADLTKNYASAATLDAYLNAIADAKNTAIFEQLCAAATPEAPVNITEKYIQNPSFAEGPKTGWNLATLPGEGNDNPDMTINTYGRGNAESWNRKPFEISQTLYSMPAGTYELRVRACYRSGGSVDENMVNQTVDGSFPYNAKVFLNANEKDVKSVCDNGAGGTGWTDPSFTLWYNGKNTPDGTISALKSEGFAADWDNTIYVTPDEYAAVVSKWEGDETKEDELWGLLWGKATPEEVQAGTATNPAKTEIDMESPAYPFDTKVGDNYYPSSMAGFQLRCEQSPEAYCNKVQLYLAEQGTIKLGLRKPVAIGSDWLIYDDFELYYLGKGATEEALETGIEEVAGEAAPQAIYNMAGQRLNKVQKGVNIVDGKKVYIK